MGDKSNSFTETVNRLVDQANIALEFSSKTSKSLTTEEDTVNMYIEDYDLVTGDPSLVTYAIPSYNTVINKLNTAIRTIDTFVSGTGKILLRDGTYREITTSLIPVSPIQITDITIPTQFKPKNNWFFESLMFPQLTVSFNLKDKIDDRSDRIVVKRIIFDNFDDTETQWFLDNIVGEEKTYYETVTYLNENNKKYWADDEVHELPLSTEPYSGYFLIIDKRLLSGKEWYLLDTLNYGIPSDTPVVKNLELAKGNFLRYNNSIYKIEDIEVSEKRVQLTAMVGLSHPAVSNSFEIYSAPFSTKISNIPIGYDECDIVFLKGINDDYNILADDWSLGIPFYTNNLILENNVITLDDYYNNYVSDFGKRMEGDAKEKFIPAYFGVAPNTPVLVLAGFQVKQINTQVNAAVDTEEVKDTQTQIESTKTLINSLKNTIAQQKAELVTITNVALRNDLNSKINININNLSKRSIEYQSLVATLSSLAYESNIVNNTPKYRIRGFFEIPAAIARNTSEAPQEIIQFEIAYRYIKLDNTGVNLESFSNTNPDTGLINTGVFSDWTLTTSLIKEKVYDSSLNRYTWVQPNIADGGVVNINQIDIPIRKGEKVEFKVRSISEAGWPNNPAKSEWSNAIIVEFPANLSGSDQITNILTDSIEEKNNIKLEETLSASGMTTHIADSIPNPNVGDGTYFKHQAINLAFDLNKKTEGGIIDETITTDLQTQLSNLAPNTYVTLTLPNGTVTSTPQITGTLQLLFQAIVNMNPSIYDEFETLIP
jgi:hypothetical protein